MDNHEKGKNVGVLIGNVEIAKNNREYDTGVNRFKMSKKSTKLLEQKEARLASIDSFMDSESIDMMELGEPEIRLRSPDVIPDQEESVEESVQQSSFLPPV